MKVCSKSLTLDDADASQLTPSDAVGQLFGILKSASSSLSRQSGTHVNGNQRMNAGAALYALSDDVRDR
jgi:hypothetical protein